MLRRFRRNFVFQTTQLPLLHRARSAEIMTTARLFPTLLPFKHTFKHLSNWLVVGPPKSGKTTLLADISRQYRREWFRSKGSQTLTCDALRPYNAKHAKIIAWSLKANAYGAIIKLDDCFTDSEQYHDSDLNMFMGIAFRDDYVEETQRGCVLLSTTLANDIPTKVSALCRFVVFGKGINAVDLKTYFDCFCLSHCSDVTVFETFKQVYDKATQSAFSWLIVDTYGFEIYYYTTPTPPPQENHPPLKEQFL